MTELISIVVPVYGAENYIEETIQTVLHQTYENWELLLVDDCSKDASVDRIKPFLSDERIRLIKQETNQGAAAARNRGILEAKGRFLAFLDADDVWKPNKLLEQYHYMKEQGVAFCFTAYEFGDENANKTGKVVHVPAKMTYREALSRTIIFTSTVMFDLTVLSKEQIMMPMCKSEDTATWWKILRSGVIAHGIDEVYSVYRRPCTSLSSNKLEALRRIWNLYRKQEHLGVVESVFYFVGWAWRATVRRL